MGHSIIVRSLTEADKPTLVGVYRETWTKTYSRTVSESGLAFMLESLDRDGVAEIVPGKDEHAYVALVDDLLVGSAVFAERHGNAYFWGMYIRPNFQRMGIGTALLRHGAERLSGDAVLRAMVLSTSPWAISFYEKMGFQRGDEDEFELAPGEPVPGIHMSISKRNFLRRFS